ncbi:hypothetical protein [Nocardia sp. NBC_00416]|uniref:hypothetical protein n=1 Tax=Nocardia sp. NBC_00416 TaxID=2975991 RepID=UPI002E1ABE70
MSPIPQPPFAAELLADLHAGNIDPELSARLWPAVQRDPDAKRYLDSLDEVRDTLAGLGSSERITRPIPGDIAARLDALAESLGSAPNDSSGGAWPVEITDPLGGWSPAPSDPPPPQLPAGPASLVPAPDNASPGTLPEAAGVSAPISLDARRRRRRIAAGLAAAAAIVIAAGAALFISDPERDTAPIAAPPSQGDEPAAGLDTAVALRTLGRHDVGGRLADPAALAACVRANGIERPVLGSSDMNFRGRESVLILVGGRNGAQITALVVGPGCAPGSPEFMTATDIG